MKNLYNKIIENLLARFIIVGGSVAVFQMSSLYVLYQIIGLNNLVSTFLAFTASIFVNFGFQKIWSFKDPSIDTIGTQFGFFLLNAIGNLFVNMALMFVLTTLLSFNLYISQAATLIFIALYNFFIYKLIFNYKKNHPETLS